jgi:hypothetical protein
MPEQTIMCPNCGKRIPVSKALTHQIEAGLRRRFELEASKKERDAEAEYKIKLSAEISKLEKAAQANLKRSLNSEKTRLEKKAKQAAAADVSLKLGALRSQLKEKNKLIAETQKERESIERLRISLEAREKTIKSEINRKVKNALIEAEEEVNERLEAEYRSRELQLQKKLTDAKNQASELKRKLEQSSQQTQGEVIELELHAVLKRSFPDDKVQAISVGKRGADVIQKVYTQNGNFCGAIIWESKNTQTWNESWLTKLRADQRRAKAELAVLVSMVLPKEIRHFAQIDGIWVAQMPLVIGLATALRINLIEAASIRHSLAGKSGKMELMFNYLSSIEFKHRIEAIVEAFRTMQDDLGKERQVIERQWAKREKQMQLVIQNISGMYGDLQGIAGQSLPKIRRLELLPQPANRKSAKERKG